MEFTTGGRLEVRITASDVGKRVSVRSLTGSGDRHAAFTDTVGVLTSWDEGVLHITRRSGQSVPIAERALVAGKVVPAAPARRRGLPAAGVRELLEVAARGWPALETAALGAWTLRAAASSRAGAAQTPPRVREGFTARANSALPLGDPGIPLDEAVGEVRRWYEERNLVPRIQVTTGGERTDELLAAELERRGWTGERHALLRVAALAPLADREPDPRVRLHRTPDDGWLSLHPRAVRQPEAARGVLTGGPSVWFATVDGGGDEPPQAVGRCVVDGRWAGFAAVEVAPDRRRRGLGTAVMAELARQALTEGASAAYLQVETGNTAAIALYDRLGFADHHAYHYRRAPQEDSDAG